jgi:DNA modification methylase
MAVGGNRRVHYVGTDPNPDHAIRTDEGAPYTKYKALAEFYVDKTNVGALFREENTCHMFQDGSEVIRDNPDFAQYKGKVDIAFTSPPYFAKEAYSEDENQSYKKFPEYKAWVQGFLIPTLRTACEWLKPGGYLLWNIADAKFGKDILPLEKTSCGILKLLDMEYVETLKMTLAQMPGGNRIDEATNQPRAKNFVAVDDIWLKYEPIFVYRKPLT